MIKVEKNYLSFAELKEKWRITSDELHYLIQDVTVIPAIAWGGLVEACHWETDAESGRTILVATKDKSPSYLQGWAFLRLPTINGNCDYKFSYFANKLYASYDDLLVNTWFRLLEGLHPYDINTASIGREYIEENSVFMAEVIDNAEVFEFGLTEPINQDFVINNPASQNAYTTDLMNILNLAVNEFFNPRKNVDPKKDEITEWLKAKGKELDINVSDNVADSIFTIIKPNDHNPKIKRA